MKRFLFLSIPPVALLGCLPLPPENTYEDQRELTVNWSIKGPDDVAASCPPGFDTIVVNACVNPDDAYTCFPTKVPCAPTGTATVQLYTSGKVTIEGGSFVDVSTKYYASIAITDETGDTIRATSFATEVDLSDDASTDLAVYPDAGFGFVSWNISLESTGSEVTSCATAGVDEVGIDYYLTDPDDGSEGPHMTTKWPCNHQVGEPDPDSYLGAGLTPALAEGDYVAQPIMFRGGTELLPRSEDLYSLDIDGEGAVSTVRFSLDVTDR